MMPVYQNTFASSGFAAEVAAMRAEEVPDPATIAGHLTDSIQSSSLVRQRAVANASRRS